MTFVTPGLLLAGLVAISVPILIHLLSRRRRRPIEWGAMRFLLEAFRKHRRRLQIEQLILLAIRCLIVGLLGAALARPLLEQTGLLPADGSRTVLLVVDDGLASGAIEADAAAPALTDQVRTARRIVDSLGPSDRIGLVTTARPAVGRIIPPSTNHAAVLELLDGLEPQQTPSDLATALDVVRTAIDELDPDERRSIVYLLSRFRRGSADLETPLPTILTELGDDVQLFASPPASTEVPNVQVVDIEPVRHLILPGATDGSGKVTVRLERHGDQLERAVTQVRLDGAGVAPQREVVTWRPGESETRVDFMLDLPEGTERQVTLTASIDHDGMAADNEHHLVLDLRRRIPAVMIDRRTFGFEADIDRMGAGAWIRRALDPSQSGRIEIVDVEPAALGPADLNAVDLVFLPRPDLLTDGGWDQLRAFVDDGGLLVVAPPGDLRVHQWTEKLRDTLGLAWRVGLEVDEHAAEPLVLANEQPRSELLRLISSELDRMTRPVVVFQRLKIEPEETHADSILTFADGLPLLLTGAPDSRADDPETRPQGLVALFAVSPELSWTNMPSQVLMVPMFQEVARQGLSLVRASRDLRVGDRPPLAISRSATQLVDPNGIRSRLTTGGRPEDPLAAAGIYEVEDRSNTAIANVAVNIEPGFASTRTQSASAVSTWLGVSGPWEAFDEADLNAALRDSQSGSALAGILLLCVLGLVLLETVLARWFSHAGRAGHGVGGGGLRGTIDGGNLQGAAA